MALITWSEKYSVGIDTIDAQHKKLIEIINDFNLALKEGRGSDVISKIIIDLTAYTQYHFETEEKFFKETGYPETAEHKMEHDQFVQNVTGFANEYAQKKSLSLVVEVSNFLWTWLSSHILTQDKKYSPWLVDHGIK